MKDNAMYVSLKKLFEQPLYIECVKQSDAAFVYLCLKRPLTSHSDKIRSILSFFFWNFFILKFSLLRKDSRSMTYISAHILSDNAK